MNIFSTFVKINLQNNFNTSVSLESPHDGRQRYAAMVRNKAATSWLMPNENSFIECIREGSNLGGGVTCLRIPQAKTCGGTHGSNTGSYAPVAFRRAKEQTKDICKNIYCLGDKVMPREIYLPHIPSQNSILLNLTVQ
jgi:hypothetical protein